MTRGRRYGPGRLWKRGATWVLDWRDETGRRRREHLGPSKREAESFRAEVIARRDRILRGLEVVHEDVALAELRDRYLDDLRARTSPMHTRNVELVLARFLEAVPARTVGELKPAHALAYRAALAGDGASNRCQNFHAGCVRAMLNWAVKHELAARNPLARVEKLPDTGRHQTQRRRALSEDDIARFLAASEAEDAALVGTVRKISQTAFWHALIATGMRYGEARLLSWGDVDLAGAVLHLRAETTKANRSRSIPLRTELVARLVALRQERRRFLGRPPGKADLVFLTARGCGWCRPSNNLRRCFLRLIDAAGIERVDAQGRKVDIHAIRHTAASRFARFGVPLVQAQRIMGHSDPKLTARVYAHLEVEDLRAAVDAVPAIGA